MKNPVILLIQNCAIEGFGLYERYLIDNGFIYRKIHPYRGDDFPAPEKFDKVFIGGTPVSAYQYREHEFLKREFDYLAEFIILQKPCFGICCGAQILAMLLGAEVKRNPVMEIGTYQVELTEKGRKDAIFDGFPDAFPVFHWHGDTFDIPENAGLLATGHTCRNQMFRQGSVVGLQFHLEAEVRDIETWVREYANEPAKVSKTPDEIISEFKRDAEEMGKLAQLLVKNSLSGIVGSFS